MNSFNDTLTQALSADLSSEVGSGKQRVVNDCSIRCDFELVTVPIELPEWVAVESVVYRFICSSSDWPGLLPQAGGWASPGSIVTVDHEQYHTLVVEMVIPAINILVTRTK